MVRVPRIPPDPDPDHNVPADDALRPLYESYLRFETDRRIFIRSQPSRHDADGPSEELPVRTVDEFSTLVRALGDTRREAYLRTLNSGFSAVYAAAVANREDVSYQRDNHPQTADQETVGRRLADWLRTQSRSRGR